MHISSLPEELIEDPILIDYWQSLKVIWLNRNYITCLPNNINLLISLEELHINEFQFKLLKNDIQRIPNLKKIVIDDEIICLTNIDSKKTLFGI